MPKKKKLPRVFMWFSSYDSGDHCNTIHTRPSEIARIMIEECEENLESELQVSGTTQAERILTAFGKIDALEFGGQDVYFEWGDGSWATITLMRPNEIKALKRIFRA